MLTLESMTSSQANSYFSLIRSQFGLLAIGFIALFTGNLGQSFFIGLFQSDIANSLNLSTGEFGAVYAALTMTSGFLVLHFGQKLDWIAPRRYALLVLTALLTGGDFIDHLSLVNSSRYWFGFSPLMWSGLNDPFWQYSGWPGIYC